MKMGLQCRLALVVDSIRYFRDDSVSRWLPIKSASDKSQMLV